MHACMHILVTTNFVKKGHGTQMWRFLEKTPSQRWFLVSFIAATITAMAVVLIFHPIKLEPVPLTRIPIKKRGFMFKIRAPNR